MSISIDQFRAEGELETRGHFRLDEDAAREKLQQFRLKDPHAWVLEFVRAAHIGEATSISFSIGPGNMACNIDGVEIPAALAKEWAHAPFEKLETTEARVLRHVAIGLSTLQGLQPTRVALEAGIGPERVRIEIENGQERVIDDPTLWATNMHKSGNGIWVESEGRFAFGVKRFFDSILGELAEVTHLKKSCKYPRLPMSINGTRVGTAMHIHASDVVVAIQSPIENGVLGLRDEGFRKLGVYQHGVLLEEIVETVDGIWNGYEALVNTTRVNTDLGGQRIVRDKSFDGLQALVESTWCRAVERRVEIGTHSDLSTFIRQTLQTVEIGRIRKSEFSPGLERLAEAFDRYPVWPVMVGHSVKSVSVDDLRRVGGRRLHYATRVFSKEHVRDGELILLADRKDDSVWIEGVSLKTLENRLDRKMYDMSGELRDREEGALNEARWRLSPVKDPKLHDMLASTRVQHQIGDEVWEIEVGLSYARRTESTWIKSGRLLGRHVKLQSGNGGPINGLDIAISISGDIPPNSTFTGPAPRSKRVRSAVVRVVEEFMNLAVGVLQGRVQTSDAADLTSRRLTEEARRLVKMAINGELADVVVSALGLENLTGLDIGYSDLIRAGASTTMKPGDRIAGLGQLLELPLYRRGNSLISLRDLIRGPELIFYSVAFPSSTDGQRSEQDLNLLNLTEWELRGLSQVLGDRLDLHGKRVDPPVSIPVEVDEDSERQLRLSELSKEIGPSVPPTGPAKVQAREQIASPFEIPEHLASKSKRSIRVGDPHLDDLADWILSRCDVVFGAPNLRGLRRVSGDGRQVARVVGDHVELDSSHPVVSLSTNNPNDEVLRSLLGSSVYTVINCHFLSVEDQHEHAFLSGVIDLADEVGALSNRIVPDHPGSQ